MDAIELLSKVPFLALASDDTLTALSRAARWRSFARGEFLYHLGDPATRIFVIAEGRVAATVSSPQGTPVMFHVATVGEAAGLVNLPAGGTYDASAQAISAVTALSIPIPACRELLETEPRCLLRLAADLAEIIQILGRSIADLVFLDLERRLARLLGESPAVGNRVYLSLTQSELAARLGVARQSVNQALSSLAERGFVAVESPGVFQMLDQAALAAFVDNAPR